MLRVREREAAAQAAQRWPKRKANLFMRNLWRGKPILQEIEAIQAIQERPSNVQYAAPEVAVAAVRQELSPAGIERALRDLMSHCRKENQNYLNLLDENPQMFAQLMIEGIRQPELW